MIKPNMAIVPSIYEKSAGGTLSYDIFSKLLSDRIVMVGGEDITTEGSNLLIAQLLYLESLDDKKPISMYINCPGGSVLAGLAIYDTMQHLKSPVATLVMGHAMSFGLVLLAAGTHGMRSSMPHARIMMHQPLIGGHGGGGISGQATDIRIEADEMDYHKNSLAKILSDHTGQTLEKVLADGERNNYFSAQQALEYGFIDRIVSSKSKTDDEHKSTDYFDKK
jgi:ATP-dependent Clp protease protease subunit